MKRRAIGAAFIAAISLAAPGMADEPAAGKGSVWSRVVSVPLSAAGVFYGVTVGVPLKIASEVRVESRRMYNTILDDMGGPDGGVTGKAMAATLGVPYGIASG